MQSSNSFFRHPLSQAADKLKETFRLMGFQFVDNGEGLEVEEPGVTFATWDEPADVFGWQNDPILLGEGNVLIRTRILPAHLRALEFQPPIRLVTYGRVHKKEPRFPMHLQIEGFVAEKGLTVEAWKVLWSRYAVTLLGLGSSASLESAGDAAYKITVKNPEDGKVFDLGYTGPASEEALAVSGIKSTDCASWVFVIDVDRFALQYFSIADRPTLYDNDVTFLRRFKSNAAAGGYTLEYRLADELRKIGYMETYGDTMYPEGFHKKMNMIQEKWDTNNRGFRLVEPLGDFTTIRTVLTFAMETILARNYERGATDVRIFEVAHKYAPVDGKLLPKETLCGAMFTYGTEVTLESFGKEVEAVFQALGFSSLDYVHSEIAIAFEGGCDVARCSPEISLNSYYGQMNKIAAQNMGIGVPAYMALFDIPTLEAAIKTLGLSY